MGTAEDGEADADWRADPELVADGDAETEVEGDPLAGWEPVTSADAEPAAAAAADDDGFGELEGLLLGEGLGAGAFGAGGATPGGVELVLPCQDNPTDWPSRSVSPPTPSVEYFQVAALPSAQKRPQ